MFFKLLKTVVNSDTIPLSQEKFNFHKNWKDKIPDQVSC